MSIIGMDPNTVIPAAGQLKTSGAKMYDAAQKASIDLFDPHGLPSNLYQRAMELGSRSSGCMTSADAMATHSIDLGRRAAMFQQIEQDTGLTATQITATNGGRPLWNHDSRHTALRNPGGYWDDLQAGVAPATAGRSTAGSGQSPTSGKGGSRTSGVARETETFVPGKGIVGGLGGAPVGSIGASGAGSAKGTEVPGRIESVTGIFPAQTPAGGYSARRIVRAAGGEAGGEAGPEAHAALGGKVGVGSRIGGAARGGAGSVSIGSRVGAGIGISGGISIGHGGISAGINIHV